MFFFVFKQKTAYEMRISDWSSDVCSSDLRYTATLGDKNKAKNDDSGLKSLAIAGDDATALAQGVAIAEGVEFARGLGNLPANICNPAYIAEQARKFAADNGAESEILDEKPMEALGMGSLLAVARGSANRPHLVVLRSEEQTSELQSLIRT